MLLQKNPSLSSIHIIFMHRLSMSYVSYNIYNILKYSFKNTYFFSSGKGRFRHRLKRRLADDLGTVAGNFNASVSMTILFHSSCYI